MTVKRWLNQRAQFLDGNGDPYSGGKLNFYEAGSSTPEATYNSDAGDTPNANPVILDSAGRPSSEIWLTGGQAYKVVLTDADDVVIWTEDDITGTNDLTNDVSEWVLGTTPTYIGASSFSVAGDQTLIYTPGRRVKITDSGGTKYGTIATSVYTSVTTITLDANSDSLASPTASLSYGIINFSIASSSLSILDEDNLVSDSALALPTQQSVKAYIDAAIAGIDSFANYVPTLSFGGASTGLTYTDQNGSYTKIGRVVFFQADLLVNAVGSSTGVAAISLPVTPSENISNSGRAVIGNVIFTGLNTNWVNVVGEIQGNSSVVTLYGNAAAAASNRTEIDNADFTTGTFIAVSGFYFSDA